MRLELLSTISKLNNFFNDKFSVPGHWYFVDFNMTPIKVWCAIFPDSGNPVVHFQYFGTAGKSLNPHQAYLAGAVERLERYSLTVKPKNFLEFSLIDKPPEVRSLDLASLKELQGVLPFQLSVKFPKLKNFDENVKLRWAKGRYLLDGSEVWVPEEAILLKPYAEQIYFPSSTNGCAAHTSYEKAVINATLELIERDSFLYLWWKKIIPTKVDFKIYLKENLPELYSAFGPWIENIEVFLIDSCLGVPTIAAIFHTTQVGFPAFLLATAAATSPQLALEKSLLELSGMINAHICFDSDADQAKQLFVDFDEKITSFSSHAHYYTNLKNAEQIYFFDRLHLRPDIDFDSVMDKFKDISNLESDFAVIDFLKDRFKENNMNPVIINQTSREIEEIGITVIRCMEPKIIELDSLHKFRRWGKSRLGININNIDEFNHLPHPIP